MLKVWPEDLAPGALVYTLADFQVFLVSWSTFLRTAREDWSREVAQTQMGAGSDFPGSPALPVTAPAPK